MKNKYTMEFEKCVFSVINCITEMISNLRLSPTFVRVDKTLIKLETHALAKSY